VFGKGTRMRHPEVFRFVRFAVLGTSLAASNACIRRSSVEGEEERAKEQSVDSARSASAQRSNSSATQAVDFDESERSRFTRVEQMIQARFSGVSVVQNGSNYTIQIRGAGSFASSNEPLIVIDGGRRTVADLRGVNPKDVLRIELMKDGAASFYGSRGANGVIVIKTIRSP
jgi:TonB-dependent SusC/RagA subfamily outer membrane receptor